MSYRTEMVSSSHIRLAGMSPEPSHHLEQLLQGLQALPEDPTLAQLDEIVRSARLNLDDVRPFLRFDSEKYCRSHICRFPNVEVLVLGWLSGQMTPIHDHAGSACVVRVLEGTATEITYERAQCGMLYPARTSHFAEGQIVSSFDEDVHQLGNVQTDSCALVTLHCYSPPLSVMNVFSQEDTIFTGYSELYNQVMKRMAASA